MRMEIFIAVALIIAMVGVVLFWTAGFYGYLTVSSWSLITAGVSCWGALIGIGVKELRKKNFCG